MRLHLAAGQGVLRMAGQPGIVDVFDLRMAGQELGDGLRIAAVPHHAQRQRLQILQRQPRVERLHDRADELGGVPADVLGQRLRPDDGPAQHRGVAGQELGDGEQDDVRAERHRLLERGGGGGVIHEQRHAPAVRHIGHPADVADEKAGVARRLHPHQLRAAVYLRVPTAQVGGILHEAELHAATLREDAGRLLVALAEDVQRGDDIVAGPRDGEDQVEKGLRAGPGGDARLAAFQRGQTRLQHGRGGGLGAAIDRVGDLVEALVGEGHRGHDRRGEGVEAPCADQGPEAGVQGLGVEPQAIARLGGPPIGRVEAPGFAHEEELFGAHGFL